MFYRADLFASRSYFRRCVMRRARPYRCRRWRAHMRARAASVLVSACTCNAVARGRPRRRWWRKTWKYIATGAELGSIPCLQFISLSNSDKGNSTALPNPWGMGCGGGMCGRTGGCGGRAGGAGGGGGGVNKRMDWLPGGLIGGWTDWRLGGLIDGWTD